MPITPLFKRAHSGVDVVNNAIQGVQDRFEARWNKVDKRAYEGSKVDGAVATFEDLVDQGYSYDQALDMHDWGVVFDLGEEEMREFEQGIAGRMDEVENYYVD